MFVNLLASKSSIWTRESFLDNQSLNWMIDQSAESEAFWGQLLVVYLFILFSRVKVPRLMKFYEVALIKYRFWSTLQKIDKNCSQTFCCSEFGALSVLFTFFFSFSHTRTHSHTPPLTTILLSTKKPRKNYFMHFDK